MNSDHSVIFEIAPKYCILHSFVDHEDYWIYRSGLSHLSHVLWESRVSSSCVFSPSWEAVMSCPGHPVLPDKEGAGEGQNRPAPCHVDDGPNRLM